MAGAAKGKFKAAFPPPKQPKVPPATSTAALCESFSAHLNFESKSVEVSVGLEDRIFHVHEATISAKSEFFAAAIRNNFKKEEHRVIRLPDQEVDTFKCYLEWIYTGRLVCPPDYEDRYKMLANIYCLAEMLIDTTLQNLVVDIFADLIESKDLRPTAKSIEIIYNNTTTESPMRALLVDIYVLYGSPSWLSADPDKFTHVEFLLDIAKDNLARYTKHHAGLLRRRGLEDRNTKVYHRSSTHVADTIKK